MDPFTASTALAIVQLCSSLVMAGVFASIPSERCTRYCGLRHFYQRPARSWGRLMVVVDPGQMPGWDALVHQADIALYRAKHEGRNAFRLA